MEEIMPDGAKPEIVSDEAVRDEKAALDAFLHDFKPGEHRSEIEIAPRPIEKKSDKPEGQTFTNPGSR